MNHGDVRKLIAFVYHSWPTVPWRTDEQAPLIVSWQMILANVTLDEAHAVVLDHATTGAQFPPAPGVICRAVLDARDRARGTLAPDPDQAWAEVTDAVSRFGYMNGEPEWSHPAVDAVVGSMTWRELCYSTNQEALRAHFLKLYSGAVVRTVAAERSVAAPLFAALATAEERRALPRDTPAVD